MRDIRMYHNPECSKSRQTLELLQDRGVEPRIIEYLNDPPDESVLAEILDMLEIEPMDLIRHGEDEYEELGLAQKKDDRQALIRAMVEHPVLIQRPIVVIDGQARIGRPPEQVLEILT